MRWRKSADLAGTYFELLPLEVLYLIQSFAVYERELISKQILTFVGEQRTGRIRLPDGKMDYLPDNQFEGKYFQYPHAPGLAVKPRHPIWLAYWDKVKAFAQLHGLETRIELEHELNYSHDIMHVSFPPYPDLFVKCPSCSHHICRYCGRLESLAQVAKLKEKKEGESNLSPTETTNNKRAKILS